MTLLESKRSRRSQCLKFLVFVCVLHVFLPVHSNEPVPTLITREALQSIIDRNPFGLKPPPPPQTNEPPPPPEVKLNINITGITRTRKGKRVHLMVQPEAKDKDKNGPRYLSIDEGDRQDGIKILEIAPKSDKVRIQTSSGESVLSFATHGLKSTAPAATAPKSGIQPPGMLPQPSQINQTTKPGPQIISRGGITRTVELPNPNTSVNTGTTFNTSGLTPVNNAAANYTIPARSLRTQQATADDGLDGNSKAALQVIQMEAQKLATPQIEFPPTPGAPGLPPIPQ